MAPHVIFDKEAMIAGGTAARFNKGCPFKADSAGGVNSLFPSLRMRNREQMPKLMQTRNRRVKLNGKSRELTRAMAREGTRAKATLFDR